MDQLAVICSRCGSARLDPDSVAQKWCKKCGGSGYELTDAGKELKGFILALLDDPEVNNKLADLLGTTRQEANDHA